MGPAVSWLWDIGMMPARLTSPTVGLIPTIPQILDGQTIEPSVSVPIVNAARFAEAAAPEPELEPQGFRSSKRPRGWEGSGRSYRSSWQLIDQPTSASEKGDSRMIVISDEGAASFVVARFLEPCGDETVMAAANGKYVLETGRGNKVGLRNPLPNWSGPANHNLTCLTSQFPSQQSVTLRSHNR